MVAALHPMLDAPVENRGVGYHEFFEEEGDRRTNNNSYKYREKPAVRNLALNDSLALVVYVVCS